MTDRHGRGDRGKRAPRGNTLDVALRCERKRAILSAGRGSRLLVLSFTARLPAQACQSKNSDYVLLFNKLESAPHIRCRERC
jgi:hypothetical protein